MVYKSFCERSHAQMFSRLFLSLKFLNKTLLVSKWLQKQILRKDNKNYFKVLGIYLIPTSINYLMFIKEMFSVSICLNSSVSNCNYTFAIQLLKMGLATSLLLICMHLICKTVLCFKIAK